MEKTYSIYEAKAKLSEVLRLVKSGNEVTITERGEARRSLKSSPSLTRKVSKHVLKIFIGQGNFLQGNTES
ncbi:MAG: type II toxin-antitoxin system prevent-host-death family antitoxin [Deltaproteobacteria bacterium]|nr:type II toxin-antitoxin system prevent-host-death family antitoxin [Deltaproteobacteria bacterium]